MGLKLSTVILLAQLSVMAFGADFNAIISNPEKFDKKRVTLVAMAEGGTNRFYLYRPPEPKPGKDEGRVIYGILLRERPLYERYNKKWVRVTGVIDMSYRGLASENACGLIIERVRPIAKVKKAKFSCDGGSCLKVEFEQVIRSPGTYEHQCVCVKGFAHVRGDAFVIYQSEKASGGRDPDSSTRDFKKGIFVSQRPTDTTDYDRYNNRWIEIKGIIDLNERGFDEYPAGIVVEGIQPSSPEM